MSADLFLYNSLQQFNTFQQVQITTMPHLATLFLVRMHSDAITLHAGLLRQQPYHAQNVEECGQVVQHIL